MLLKRFMDGRNKIKETYGTKEQRYFHIAGATGFASIVLGFGKICFGLASLSLFICVNGCYTIGMAAAKYCALFGAAHAKEKQGEYFYYRFVGIIMLIASLLYIAYSIQSVFHPNGTEYGEITAITIATITFAEIGINMRGFLKYRKSDYPLVYALKTIGLSTSLISLVLTQSTILSFVEETQNPSVNGFLGAIMGGCAALLSVYMIWRIRKMEKRSGGNKNDTHIGGR